ncbi:Signal transduction histidine-protein kinase BarA [Symmachiella macrocystis]|uniref:Sensory/regulatory protein RpfC n=1 Tax=Symmachiella macrocystis TaxID=2527985 RepID=A0A5C6BA40_9PLAN|nr:response regulator [Symmachiella macrocystis]TWU09135.1 Signal transduction histidine-protein kinase BarA [Symmachiella macrocystis]
MDNDTQSSHVHGEDLPERAALLAKLLASTNDLVWCTDLAGDQLLYLNGAAERIYGRPLADFVANSRLWLELVHPEDRERVNNNLRVLPKQRQIEQEYRIVRPDGSIRWLRDCVTVIDDDAGVPSRIGGIATDVTRQKRAEEDLSQSNSQMQSEVAERKQAEDALKGSEGLYHSLVDNLPIYVTRTDLQGRITFVNNNYCELVEMTPEELLGRTNRDLHPDEYAEKYRHDELRVIETGEVFIDVEENRRGDEVRYYEVRKSPVRDKSGNVVQVQAVFWDVTERHESEVRRKQAEEAMREAKEAAESANRAKSEFLANMSHEIRTPMNAIIGMTELVLDGQLNVAHRESLQIVRESSESLLSIINDILDFSKIEAQKLELIDAEFDLHESLGDAMKSIAMRAHGKNIELAFHIDRDVPNFLLGDVGRLRQIAVNLVGNAIKFTTEGEVVLNVSCDSRDDKDVVLHFQVKDTGIGIAADKQNHIFDAFEQADSSSTRQFGGTGLGLAISSRLVGLMDGRIWVESELDHGSTFHFTSRFEEVTEPAKRTVALPPEALEGLRVLIVDDNATNRLILEELVSHWGMQPLVASAGEEALQMLRRSDDDGAPISLILTDIHMPHMDGYEFVRRAKQLPPFRDVTVIALTSGDRASDEFPTQEIGIAIQLSKPVKRQELMQAILVELALVPQETTAGSATSISEMANIRPLRILLAEDSYANQKLAIGLLKKWKHTITIANNGREALDAFQRDPFDLVLMDVQMPVMDGFEATGAIREIEKNKKASHQPQTRTPIVAMTAHAMKGDREKCLAVGMDGYVAKPIRIPLLYEAIAEFFEEPTDSAAATTNDGANGDSQDSISGCIDWAVALDAVQGDHDLLREVASASVEECKALMTKLEQAVQLQDATATGRAAHTVKGLLRMFPSKPAAQIVQEIEDNAHQGEWNGLESSCESLKEQLIKLGAEISEFVKNGTLPGQ